MRLSIRVRPGASRTRVGGSFMVGEPVPGRPDAGPALVVAVSAPAVDGRATEAALRAVAEALEVRPRDVTLVSGATSRTKVVEVPDSCAAAVLALLSA